MERAGVAANLGALTLALFLPQPFARLLVPLFARQTLSESVLARRSLGEGVGSLSDLRTHGNRYY